ncbi:hypothetical protein A2Z22_03390 [Candidatus Woesebacteria bacterium RBG_16_34_12]|uniref:MGS-like domain-containing protein n=1 Tax=Candidatus Woesebacteria bacterium RBG_16_34_12 TaxID=1802480 RepID=A0A1F7XCI8_9BACT|nr:MAG: hypothetical protein A2Z22_03390 [Candidatus Woesebacteria bacterium RBG_16_34_12]
MSRKKKLRILISVYDKSGLIDFVNALSKNISLDIISTGGTAKYLSDAGFTVKTVESVTGFPEILSGRVKTLHPKIHAGILADQDNRIHIRELKKHSIKTIDLVVVNLYPFEQTIKRKGVTLNQAVEQIDIGGVALLRAAAKNFKHVLVISDTKDYDEVLEKLKKNQVTQKLRKKLAVKVFYKISNYDKQIGRYLE